MINMTNNEDLKHTILKQILDFYLESRDSNGISFISLYENYQDKCIEIIKELITENKIDLYFNDVNPHVMHFEPMSTEKQIAEFDKRLKLNLHNKKTTEQYPETINIQIDYFCCCIYPDKKIIKGKIKHKYNSRPYSKELCQERICLDFRVFDNKILLDFINDPRYYHHSGDYVGSLDYSDKHSLRSDKRFIPHYYFAINKQNKYDRKIAILLCDLHKIPSKDQRDFKRYEINKDNYKLHPICFQMICGHWPDYASIFSAFCEELDYINRMCIANKFPPLFKQIYKEKPVNFTFLMIPTEEYFQSFLHTLDIMLSDNIDINFFKSPRIRADLFQTTKDHEGHIYKEMKKPLKLLRDWVEKNFKPYKPDTKHPAIEIYDQFCEIRKLRSKGKAHNIIANRWDDSLVEKQMKIMIETYKKLRLIRLMLANLPSSKDIKIDDDIYLGKILDY